MISDSGENRIILASFGVTVDAHESYLLVVGVLLYLLFSMLYRYRKKVQEEYISIHILKALCQVPSSTRYWIRAFLMILSWLLIALSMMRPRILYDEKKQNQGKAEEVSPTSQLITGSGFFKPNIDTIIFVLDVSQSMSANDSRDASSRLARAKDIIHSFLESIGGINASLYVFSGNSVLYIPPTIDYLYFRVMLDNVRINEPGIAGTSIIRAVSNVKKDIENSPYKYKNCVVFISDGENTDSSQEDGSKSYLGAIQDNIEQTTKMGAQWFAIEVGTEVGKEIPDFQYDGSQVISHSDPGLLKHIAEAGSGHFYNAYSLAPDSIAHDILSRTVNARHDQELDKQSKILSCWRMQVGHAETTELYYYPLALGIILLILALTISPFEERNAQQ